MNITLDNNMNQLAVANGTLNYKEKHLTENAVDTCSNGSNGVILELSQEAVQDGFVRIKEQTGDVATNTAQVASTRALSTSQIQEFQTRLRSLGFYSGSQDGNPSSSAFIKAVYNFQKTYGLNPDGNIEDSATQDKIRAAYSKYMECKSSAGTAQVKSAFSLDSTQTNNFALTWTYLKVGMGLSDVQASGVMGNIYSESAFSSTNAQDAYGYREIYDTGYNYNAYDSVGYGLMQWTYYERKENLAEIASDMGVGVGNINAQLALMQYESTHGEYSSAWNKLKNSTSVASATEIVMYEIERPRNLDEINQRIAYANTIYNAMT